MDCQELVELVTEYLEGGLTRQERARFEAHLAECEACRAYVDQLRRTVRALGRLPAESLSSEATDALLAAFRGWSRV